MLFLKNEINFIFFKIWVEAKDEVLCFNILEIVLICVVIRLFYWL